MLYKYFPPNLTHVTALPCETQMFSSVTIRWNVLFATKYLTTELAHSKLNMVYLADLLVVMTDGLKIVRIRAWNVPRVHGHKRLDDGAFLASLSRSTKATVSRADVPGSCWYIKNVSGTIKNRLWTTCTCLAVASEQERKLSRQYALFTLIPNLSNLIVTNPVLGKNLEHPLLTR